MSLLTGFLIFILSLTALVIIFLTKHFQEENIIYLNNNQMKNTSSISKKVEKEKVFVERLNSRFAMIDLIAAVGAYLTTDQIIPGFIWD